MKHSNYSLLFVLMVAFCMSCSNSSNQSESQTRKDSVADSPSAMGEDTDTLADQTEPAKEDNSTDTKSVDDWKTEDFIISKKDKSSESVRSTIEDEREQWKNVKSPFIATYQGCEMGDYFHLNFEDAKGKSYDFGFGDNTYGKYTLFNDKEITDNPKYPGKSFKIYWDWKVSEFPCCEGSYDLVKAYLPSITKLELIEKKDNK